jgi:hypothetical protein
MYVIVDEIKDKHVEMSVRDDIGNIIKRFRVWKDGSFTMTDVSWSEGGYARVYDSQWKGPPKRPFTWPGMKR